MLESRARARSAAARSVERARIVLLAAGGMQDKQIAAKLRIMPEKAARWRNRWNGRLGLGGARGGRNKLAGRSRTICATDVNIRRRRRLLGIRGGLDRKSTRLN